jgi:hypothetical protein
MPLRLTTVALPGHEATAQVHATSGDAAWHLSNHVLVEPECFAWGYILPDWKDTLDTAPSATRHYHRTQIRHTNGDSGQALYDAYAAAITQDAADAARLRWWVRWDPPITTTPPPVPIGKKKRKDVRPDAPPRPPRPVVVALGLRAVLMVFEKEAAGWFLKTAFVPGQGDPREIADADHNGRPRANTPPRTPRGHLPDESAALDEKWTDDQWYYYRVFRPALKFIGRRREDIRMANNEQLLARHYGLLHPRIPTELRTGDEVRWLNFCLTMRGDPAASAKTG